MKLEFRSSLLRGSSLAFFGTWHSRLTRSLPLFWITLIVTPLSGICGGVVTNCTEANLNAALSGGGTVTFTCDGTITVTTTKVISASTTIDGAGRSITISGGSTTRLFTVQSNVGFTLLNLLLADGQSTNGGAVYSQGGTLVVSNCVFARHQAIGAKGMDGTDGDANCPVGRPGSQGGPGNTGSGGAIWSQGSLSITRSLFLTNAANGGKGGNGGRGGPCESWVGGDGGSAGWGGAAYGGAIYSSSSLSLLECFFLGNQAAGGQGGLGGTNGLGSSPGRIGDGGGGGTGHGGGVYHVGQGNISRCTFRGNIGIAGDAEKSGAREDGDGQTGVSGASSYGGGLYVSGTNIVSNCTLFANTVNGGKGGDGGNGLKETDPGGNGGVGGTGAGGAIWSSGTALVTNVTFSSCDAYGGAGGAGGTAVWPYPSGSNGADGASQGGNIANGSGAFILRRSILAYSTSGSNGYGTITDAGRNISSDASLTFTNANSQTSTDPLLATLADNGGFTMTCALLPGSPAIDAGGGSGCLPTDQRGYMRWNSCDIGSFEVNGRPPTSVDLLAVDANANEGGESGLFVITRMGDTALPLTVLYSIGGTASNGVDYAYLSNAVTIPANEVFADITVAPRYDLLIEGDETVSLTLLPGSYTLGAATNAVVTISDFDDGSRKPPVVGGALASTARYGRFTRGSGTDPNYHSFVVPVDFQQGVPLDLTGGNGTNLFPGISWSSLNHYNITNPASPLVFQNPIVAFGGRVGGSPLYFGQSYAFGIYAGDPQPHYTNTSVYANALRVRVHDANGFALIGTTDISIPNISDPNAWANFLTNGYTKTVTDYGLTTTLSFNNLGTTWDAWSSTSNYYDVAFHLTHKAAPGPSNYVYLVELAGGTERGWMVTNSSGVRARSRLYTLEFEERPAWRSLVLQTPQFFGEPLPAGYAGRSAEEFRTNGFPVTNAVNLTNPAAYITLDHSPELRRHSLLNQFVTDMGNDPLALANYVLNEIELTDAIDYNDSGAISETAVNLGGVNRGALGVFLEGQGSPTEQCALLVYLLRRAGYPAVYLFAPHNGLKLVDARLSKLLRTQIQGAVNAKGTLYTTNQLIPVNYPWVGLYLTNEARWVHLFPWLKDTQVEEGFNLYDYMPAQYDNAFKWARAYLYGDTSLLSLNPTDDSPLLLYPRFIQKTLLERAPGISMDDIGIKAWNRRNYHVRWSDFPVPTSLVSSNIPVESLGSPSVTNVAASLTNIFNTVSVEISSVANTNKKVSTGPLRLAEMHNRRLVAWHSKVSSSNHTLTLSLAAFRSGLTATKAFEAALLYSPTNTDVLVNLTTNVSLATTDDFLNCTIVHQRHRSLPGSYAPDHWSPYLGFSSPLVVANVRQMRKGDLAGICLDVGRVTRRMLDQHATEIWQMEAAGVADSTNCYQGSIAYLMGMSFFEKADRFTALVCRLHKVQPIACFGSGLALLRAKRDVSGQLPNGDVILVQPVVDMFNAEIAAIGNRSIHLDSGDDGYSPDDRAAELAITGWSALEHNILNRFFKQSDSVSTIRLLQRAQKQSPGIVVLNRFNHLAEGEKPYPPASTNKLKDADPVIWMKITNTFASDYVSNNVQVFITPGRVTNDTQSYKGVGAMVFSPSSYAALIGTGLNGGYSPPLPDQTLDSGNAGNVNLTVDKDNNFVFDTSGYTSADDVLTGKAVSTFDQPALVNEITGATLLNDNQGQALDLFASMSGDTASGLQAQATDQLDVGAMFKTVLRNTGEFVQDPVNAVTGEFYIDTVDLRLNGPMPLDVRRNYSSQNVFDSEFGFGWKPAHMPYLMVSVDSTILLIHAAEPDGTVLAYRRQTNASGVLSNIWLPTLQDNPRLQNLSGSIGNLFNSSITRVTNSSFVTYTLRAPDGGTRCFIVGSYALSTNITRTRPYLDTWQDSRGNYLKFSYGTNSASGDFGKVRRVEASNGNFLGFRYDVYGHVIEAWTGDGRRLAYEYDDFGDLVRVCLPDASEIGYEYARSLLVTNTTEQVYSTHLLIRESKPEGRLLQNDYDLERRVVNQYATVGSDLRLIRNASFTYSNNFTLATSLTNLVKGRTLITDYLTNVTRYEYTNSLITLIVDPLDRTNRQDWYFAGDTNVGAYAGSLKTTVDPRGLRTDYRYDPQGNVTNVTVTGDLRGGGVTTETAVTTQTYNTNRLLSSLVDTVGNRTAFTYTNPLSPFLRTSEERYASNGTLIATTVFDYYSVTNTATPSNYVGSFGLLRREIRAFNSTDAATNQWAHDARGFPTNEVRFTGTSDPAVSNAFFYNLRGELVEKVDAAGGRTTFSYNARGNMQWREVFDEQGSRLSAESSYYNLNGELTWSDGPRFDPEDYIWREYDGAGRKTQEVHWRSRGKEDGTGVEAEVGDSRFATTFYEYDPFNNLVKVIDPRGHYTRMTYDAAGQLVARRFYDGTTGTDATPLATEGFAYEKGGQVAFHTNALGGLTEKRYTSRGQLKWQRNPDGSTAAWSYQLDGRLATNVLANGSYWRTLFDDAARLTTQIFCSASHTPLATNSTALDRRGNVIRRVDAAFHTFTNLFDGLDRLRIASGPAVISTPPTNAPPAPGGGSGPTTNQQVTTYFYDASSRVTTNANALGEKTVTFRDALGRVTGLAIYAAGGALVRTNATVYSVNHHDATLWEGSGTNALATRTFTDNDGQPVFSLRYPASGVAEYTWQAYDPAGNRTQRREYSWSNSVVTLWATNAWTYDGLNRVKTETVRDGATTTNAFNALGNLTQRAMPGGLTWSATYTNDGRILTEQDSGGGTNARVTTYRYYGSNHVAAGRLWTVTDGRGVTRTNSYDDFQRLGTVTASGTDSNQQMTVTWQYDARSLFTNLTQSFASTNTGPATTVRRSYDPYSQIVSETVSMGGSPTASAGQSWNSAGRRSLLSVSGAPSSVDFAHRADGLMTKAGEATFGYADSGLLTGRTNSFRSWTVTARDGMGRRRQTVARVGNSNVLSETLAWRGDGLLSDYTAARGDFTDTRHYAYASWSRRLVEESLYLSASQPLTNFYAYDQGQSGQLGVLTSASRSSSQLPGQWGVPASGGLDGLKRVTQETNTLVRRTARGQVNGPAALRGTLNSRSVALRYDGSKAGQWTADLELAGGTNTLTVYADHPSGQFTNNATSTFTLTNKAADTLAAMFDGQGNLTQRVWKNYLGQTNRTQTLAWDAFNRLVKVTERDAQNHGYNWQTVFDGLGRRVRTLITLVSNNVATATNTLVHYYDPQVEFLEIGVSVNGVAVWKLYGPDGEGAYGSQQGLGGLELLVRGSGQTNGVLQDHFGNVIAGVNSGAVQWVIARSSSYGPVEGTQLPALAVTPLTVEHLLWRGKWRDVSGDYYWGARPYRPERGAFLSFDPYGHADGWNPGGYTVGGGDLVNNWDADARLAKQAGRQAVALGGWASDTALNMAYGLGAGLNWAAGVGAELTQPVLGLNPQPFYASMEQWRSQMSPYGRSGFYDEQAPATQVLNAGSMFLVPESVLGRVGTAERVFAGEMIEATANIGMRERVLANIADSQAARATSQFETRTARDFFFDSGIAPKEIDSRLAGIDFSRPVTVDRLVPGESVVQYQASGVQGSYYAPIGTSASSLGIDPSGRIANFYDVSKPISVLRSTAADTTGNLLLPSPARGPGGGIQYFSRERAAFTPRPGI